jgi:serine/threonine protein kinase
MGTPNYMSPEQVRGEIADARSDLWSLGIVLYESLAGQRPFDGSSAADIVSNIIAREPAPLSALNRDVPVELARLVTGLLSKERDRRNSAAEVVQALKRLVESVAARPARSRRQKVVGAAVVLVASLLSASGWWASSLVITSIFVAPCASARPRRFSAWRSIMALAFIRNTRPNSRMRSPLRGRGCHGVEGHGGRNPPPHIRGSRCYASLTGASILPAIT